MSILFAAFLGLVQGLTEFLPVSSDGHLSIMQNLFGLKNIGQSYMLFDVLLHFGTLIAIFIFYWKDIVAIIQECIAVCIEVAKGKKREDKRSGPNPVRRLILLIIVATLPLVLVVPVKDFIESLGTKTWFVGLCLLFTGSLLYISDKVIPGKKSEKNTTMTNALVIGLMQALAVLPGVSRSGCTITTSVFCGCDRSFAVKFSFLLAIPAVLGANIFSIFDALKSGIDTSLLLPYLIGMTVAAIVGYFSIRLVKLLADKGKFGKFAYYCWAVGLITVIASIIV